MAIVIVVSDTQAPFQHPKTLEHLLRTRDKYVKLYPKKRVRWVHIGDEVDWKHLKYASINDPHTAEQQHELSLKFLHSLYKEIPIARVCHSNHVMDRFQYAAEKGAVPSFMLKTIPDILEAPIGWRWAHEWIIDGVKYVHGHKFKGVHPYHNALKDVWCSVVMGHHPKFGVVYKMVNGQMFFGMGVGAMTISDRAKSLMAYGMAYSRKYSAEMPLGIGVVVDGRRAYPEAL